MSNWRGTIFLPKKKRGDYWEAFAEDYPEVFRQVERITERAGTWEADAQVLSRAAALLADYHDWMIRAKLAMFSRKAIAFDGLCRESEQITADMVGERAPVECIHCGLPNVPLHPIDGDHAGFVCPECLANLT